MCSERDVIASAQRELVGEEPKMFEKLQFISEIEAIMLRVVYGIECNDDIGQ